MFALPPCQVYSTPKVNPSSLLQDLFEPHGYPNKETQLLSTLPSFFTHLRRPANMSDESTVRIPMQKSISAPQVRSESRPLRLRNEISTISVRANFASNTNGIIVDEEGAIDGTSSTRPNGEQLMLEVGEGATRNISMRPQRRVRFSDSLSPLSPAVCRICHGGEISCPFNNGEPLISPCHCSGSMGVYHRSCLEKWLSASNTDKCEICKFQYMVARVPKKWKEFVCNPGSPSIRRNMIGDLMCLCVLTPMAFASCWLCIAGAVAVAQSGSDAIAVPGLVSLAVFLLITYLVWFSISLRYHFQIWHEWRDVNHSIRLITADGKGFYEHRGEDDEDMDGNNNASPSPFETVQLRPMADILLPTRSTDTNAGTSSSTSTVRYSSPYAFEYPNPGYVWDTAL